MDFSETCALKLKQILFFFLSRYLFNNFSCKSFHRFQFSKKSYKHSFNSSYRNSSEYLSKDYLKKLQKFRLRKEFFHVSFEKKSFESFESFEIIGIFFIQALLEKYLDRIFKKNPQFHPEMSQNLPKIYVRKNSLFFFS